MHRRKIQSKYLQFLLISSPGQSANREKLFRQTFPTCRRLSPGRKHCSSRNKLGLGQIRSKTCANFEALTAGKRETFRRKIETFFFAFAKPSAQSWEAFVRSFLGHAASCGRFFLLGWSSLNRCSLSERAYRVWQF